MPPIPTNTILRSKSGNPGEWEDVSGVIKATNNIRAITAWKGKLYVAVSEGDPRSPEGTKAVVFASADPKRDGWHRVSIPGFGGNNSEIYSLAVFDEHLYASTVNLVTGFEVWKTIGEADSDDPDFGQELHVWTPVIRNGFGDTWNQYGMSMAAFGEHLYLGTAVGIGMVIKDGGVVGTRPIEIIRIGKNDEAELIVGSRQASDPIDGGPSPREPRSGIGAGFGNPFNVYAWDMNVYENCLYVGTFDTTVFILGALQGNPELLRLFMSLYPTRDLRFPKSINAALTSGRFTPTVLAQLDRQFSGGDLWKSCDGVVWRPVTLNGFGNPLNYGIREVTPIQGNDRDVALAVGTANPFTGKPNGGCEVWLNGTLPEYELQR
jgi:hypothetical protein